MNLFKNTFANSLTTEGRYRWVSAIQLNQIPFVFCETILESLVRVLEIKEGGFNVLLEPQNRGEVASWAKDHQLPVVYLQHSETHTQLIQSPSRSLWKELLPFPWNVMVPEGTKNGQTIGFSDSRFQEEWDLVKGALSSLEAELKKSEISAIVLRDGSSPITFLFHFVRGRLLNTGIQPEALSAESLQKGLGTSVTWMELASPKDLNLFGLKASRETIQKACESARTLFPVVAPLDPVIHFEL